MEHSLLVEIEKYRQKMILCSKTNNFTSEEVIKISQRLDHLLNKHTKYTSRDIKNTIN